MNERPLSQIVREILVSAAELLRSEIDLARTEVLWSIRRVGHQGSHLGIGVSLVLLGSLSLLAFGVLALGALLNNYWLSALLVGVVLALAGAVIIRAALRQIGATPLKPTAIQGLANDRELLATNVSDSLDQLRKTS